MINTTILLAVISNTTGLNCFNIKFFTLQHQISSINIKRDIRLLSKLSSYNLQLMNRAWFFLFWQKLRHTDAGYITMIYRQRNQQSLRTPPKVVHDYKQPTLTRYNKLSPSLLLHAQQIELTLKTAVKNLVYTVVPYSFTFVLLLHCQ